MKLIKPNVVFWEENQDTISQKEHLVRCASVTHASTPKDIDRIERLLLDSGHHSVFRHISYYAVVPADINEEHIMAFMATYRSSPFIEIERIGDNWLIATNHQFMMEHEYPCQYLANYVVTPRQFIEAGGKNMIRLSMYIDTQISTTRELNRVSPNAISEESTRYCNYNKDKFDNDVSICMPHWFDIFADDYKDEPLYVDYVNDKFKFWIKENGNIIVIPNHKVTVVPSINYDMNDVSNYLKATAIATNAYLQGVKNGMLPQDVRGVLPLDTASHVVYTYSINEWKHILDLRYHGVTGTPHRNAFCIASKIINILAGMGYRNIQPNNK